MSLPLPPRQSFPAAVRPRRVHAFAGRLVLLLFAWFATISPAGQSQPDAPASAPAASSPTDTPAMLHPAVQVDGRGIFARQLFDNTRLEPSLRLGDAPAFGQTLILDRQRLSELLAQAGATLTNWTGPGAVRVSRRSRTLSETELLPMLTAALQEQSVRQRGELELRLSRPWQALTVPDEPLRLRVLELPTMGVTAAFIVRFELLAPGQENLGSWQASLQAHVWREIWVARSSLRTGQPVRETDVARERRDVLLCRDNLAELDPQDPALEVAEPVAAGTPLTARAFRPRTAVHRGQTLEARLQDGALAIVLKVEALEDGAAGQLIRVRNPISRRDLRGKVVDEQTVLISL